MIHAVLIFNTTGKPRLIKFYDHYSTDLQQRIVDETFRIISARNNNQCHFVETNIFDRNGTQPKDLLLMYRQYATLYVAFCVDKAENELAILDLIQIFVEVMDRCFESVCELDLIFNLEKIHHILNEIIIGGLVIETNIDEIMEKFKHQMKLDKSSAENKTVKVAANMRKNLNFEGRLKELKKSMKLKIHKNGKHNKKQQE
ncbi:hypothetical protein RDWZM_002810 [Blomia tropicalis]|uniref:AP complex mu/sigma subunit domain-containing protein n=1 Tax=Blomia tropicalis TaxID=40697 RepID=A0A9Q0MEE5_BLOTA|nr:hypothetical protein RDWZM_002810 [Blomia tropicalis]